jgi:peroxiredoxin
MANSKQNTKPPFQLDLKALAQCAVLDENGQKVPFSFFWRDHTALLIFLRHFACIACRAHAQEVWADRAKYEANGARIKFIGNGSSDFIKKFKEDLGILEAPVYTDPTLESFKIAGFKRGFLISIGPQAIKNFLVLKNQGHQSAKYEKAAGDLWQLGGVLVVRPDNRVSYQYISHILGDFPPEKDVTT